MVKLHSAETFIKDPINKWGKETTIGLAEHAVRTHSPPLLCDGRGDVKFYDDYEQPTKKFNEVSAGASTAQRSIDTCRTGEFSLKLTTGATTADLMRCVYYSHGRIGNRVGCNIAFAPGDAAASMINSYISISSGYDDGATYHFGKMRIDSELDKIQIYNSAGGYTDLVSISPSTALFQDKSRWADMKLVIDVSKNKYVRAIIYGIEYDLSSYDIYTAAQVLPRKLQSSVELTTKENVSHIAYIDNFIITENEPQ